MDRGCRQLTRPLPLVGRAGQDMGVLPARPLVRSGRQRAGTSVTLAQVHIYAVRNAAKRRAEQVAENKIPGRLQAISAFAAFSGFLYLVMLALMLVHNFSQGVMSGPDNSQPWLGGLLFAQVAISGLFLLGSVQVKRRQYRGRTTLLWAAGALCALAISAFLIIAAHRSTLPQVDPITTQAASSTILYMVPAIIVLVLVVPRSTGRLLQTVVE